MTSQRPAKCPPVSVIICTLNEAQNLPHVLPKIPDWVDEILLVDGHSTDDTVAIAKTLVPDIKIVTQPGRGKGDALKFGIAQAQGEIIVTLDADGETPPEEINKFIEPLLNGYDFAKGSRLYKHKPLKMPKYRWFGNKVLAITCNVLFNTRFSDICSGYNSFKKKNFSMLDLTCNVKELGCSMEQQMIIRAKKSGMKVTEVPHTSNGRLYGNSVLSNVKQSVTQGFRNWFLVIGERFRD